MLLIGSPLLTGSLSVLVIVLAGLIVGLVLHRSRQANVKAWDHEHEYDALAMRLRHPVRYRVNKMLEWLD